MRDIVLVTVDSLRADHVGWHGYDRDTTPYLDDRADSARTFSNAFAHACSTRPSFPSILTSSYALAHGGFERLSSDRTTVAELLSGAGYDTAGFHSNLYLSADFGYDRGFDEFFDSKSDPDAMAKLRQAVKTHLDDDGRLYGLLQRAFNATEKRAGIELGSAYVDAAEITDRALSWATGAGPDSPRFLWVHYMDVHHPYVPPAEHQRRFRDDPIGDRDAVQLRRKMLESPGDVTDAELDDIVDLYDAEIAYVDAEVRRLVETLRAEWGDDLLVAFTADHGEEFLDHGGFSHAATFYDEVLHVPLLLDGRDGGTCEDLVGLLDLAPTLAETAGVEPPAAFRGESLSAAGTDDWDRSTVVAEWSDRDAGDRRFGLRTTDWKYVREEDGTERLYDLAADPAETENLVEEAPDALADLRERLADHERMLAETEADLGDVEMEAEMRQRLRDLGYQE